MQNNENLFPFLKKDAIIPPEMGVPSIERLNNSLLVLIEGKTPEELEKMRVTYEKKEQPEPWMEPIVVIQSLLVEIHNKATELGFIEMKQIGDIQL